MVLDGAITNLHVGQSTLGNSLTKRNRMRPLPECLHTALRRDRSIRRPMYFLHVDLPRARSTIQ